MIPRDELEAARKLRDEVLADRKRRYNELSLEADQMQMPPRQDIIKLACSLLDDRMFMQFMSEALSDTDQRIALVYRQWAMYGLQSVQMPETYAAGLMATDAHNAVDEKLKLPWPAFEILVPKGLLESGTGPVSHVYAIRIPDHFHGPDEFGKHHTLGVAYQDPRAWGVRSYVDLKDMFRGDYPYNHEEIPEGLADNDEDKEERCWSLITRLVAGVVLAITDARIDNKNAFPQKPPKSKHGGAKANTCNLGKPLKIDCRPALRAFLSGERDRELTLSTWVRGHWRNQAYGKAWSLRRPRWIEPFCRGDGPLNIRPVHLGGTPEKEKA